MKGSHFGAPIILVHMRSSHLQWAPLLLDTSPASRESQSSRHRATRPKQSLPEPASEPVLSRQSRHRPLQGTRTISNAPLSTPQRTLLYHSPPSRTASGSSTNSASGFSSNVRVKNEPALACGEALLGLPGDEGGGGAVWVTVGVMFRNDLNPT
jgi:hypothetical protein